MTTSTPRLSPTQARAMAALEADGAIYTGTWTKPTLAALHRMGLVHVAVTVYTVKRTFGDRRYTQADWKVTAVKPGEQATWTTRTQHGTVTL